MWLRMLQNAALALALLGAGAGLEFALRERWHFPLHRRGAEANTWKPAEKARGPSPGVFRGSYYKGDAARQHFSAAPVRHCVARPAPCCHWLDGEGQLARRREPHTIVVPWRCACPCRRLRCRRTTTPPRVHSSSRETSSSRHRAQWTRTISPRCSRGSFDLKMARAGLLPTGEQSVPLQV